MSRPLTSLTTVRTWLKDFPGLELDGNQLRCVICDVAVSIHTKSDVKRHCLREKHIALCFGESSASGKQKNFNLDLTKIMITYNIPWAHLENSLLKEFLVNCTNGEYLDLKVPSESTLRKNYLPQLRAGTMSKPLKIEDDLLAEIGRS